MSTRSALDLDDVKSVAVHRIALLLTDFASHVSQNGSPERTPPWVVCGFMTDISDGEQSFPAYPLQFMESPILEGILTSHH